MSDSMPGSPELAVVDNPERSRFELVRDGSAEREAERKAERKAESKADRDADHEVLGFLEHRPVPGDPSVVVLPHTVIDRALRGQGLGAILVRGALDQLRARGQTVVPQCWFVAEFVEAHGEYADLVAS